MIVLSDVTKSENFPSLGRCHELPSPSQLVFLVILLDKIKRKIYVINSLWKL